MKEDNPKLPWMDTRTLVTCKCPCCKVEISGRLMSRLEPRQGKLGIVIAVEWEDQMHEIEAIALDAYPGVAVVQTKQIAREPHKIQ